MIGEYKNVNNTLPSDIQIYPGVFPGYMTEEELVNHIENQFTDLSDLSVRKDYLWLFALHFLKFSPTEDLKKLETLLNHSDDDEIYQSYLAVMDRVKLLFSRFGVNLDGCEDYDLSFDLIYNLYNIFVIDLGTTLANYLLGLKSPMNDKVGNPKDYDTNNFDNDIVLTQSLDMENYDPEEIEKFRRSVEEAKANGTTIVNSDNSLVFKNILIKAFFDPEFSFDNFFDIITIIDQSDKIVELLELIDLGKVVLQHDLLYHHIKEAISYPNNMELIENIYKTIEENSKFKNDKLP